MRAYLRSGCDYCEDIEATHKSNSGYMSTTVDRVISVMCLWQHVNAFVNQPDVQDQFCWFLDMVLYQARRLGKRSRSALVRLGLVPVRSSIVAFRWELVLLCGVRREQADAFMLTM
ncbi:unnamed protein product [Prorocentrum cordatum]|uniref:Uncharacterized protein n=1 Tax=Prorocentrum cordatum TaxID=2364126 RepID=A0ABN9PRU4_9DINO|nr:unnamed protein product [Polarella glacialis]